MGDAGDGRESAMALLIHQYGCFRGGLICPGSCLPLMSHRASHKRIYETKPSAFGPATAERFSATMTRRRELFFREYLIDRLAGFCFQQVLTLYSLYYNKTRTHLGRQGRAAAASGPASGTIAAAPMLSRSHHRYMRI